MHSRLAYVVVAHKNPAQVARLVRRLATDHARFLIHVDRRAGAVEAELRSRVDGLDVVFLERQRCYWGGFGMVRATLSAFERLVTGDDEFDHAVLVSGQDYPLRPPAEIESFLGEHLGRSFMTAMRFPTHWPDGGFPRIERWHLVSPLVLHVRLPWRRRLPHGLAPYGGGAWMCLSRTVVEHVVDILRRKPEIVRFFRHALIPDELLFQTVVMNSPLADTVVNDHLRFIDWSTDPAPAILRAADLERLVASEKLFARKFDESVDATILELLDNHTEGRTRVPAS